MDSVHGDNARPSGHSMQDGLAPLVGPPPHNPGVEENIPARFAARIRDARERRRLTQTQASEHAGYKGHQPVANWEDGANYPALDAFAAVAELYQVSADWLLWGGEMSRSIDARVRAIPKVARDALIMRLHDEIDATEEALKRFPKEVLGKDVVADNDRRLDGWSAVARRRADREAASKGKPKDAKSGD